MAKKALMFGSIGTMAETSDIQRRAYNQALQEAGVDWQWDEPTYSKLLDQAGGKERLSMLADATGADLSAEQIERIHARKTELACAELASHAVGLRPGVEALLRAAKGKGMKLAFVTTTYRPNIDAIFAAAGDRIAAADFDHIVSRDAVEHGKPAPDCYRAALLALGIEADDALAVEDTANSVMAAKRAGLQVVATPGRFTSGQDFWQADLVVENLADAGGRLEPRVVAMLD